MFLNYILFVGQAARLPVILRCTASNTNRRAACFTVLDSQHLFRRNFMKTSITQNVSGLSRRGLLIGSVSAVGFGYVLSSGLLAEDKKAKVDCSKKCRECATTCKNCITCCKEDRPDCAKLCEACHHMCLTCASLHEQKSALAADVCVLCEKLCRDCAALCDKGTKDCCKECAKMCRECADACKASR